MTNTYTFRLTADGVTQLQSQLTALGPAGVASFQKIIDAAPGLGSALDNAAKKAEAAHARLVAATQADFNTLQASLSPAIAAQQSFAKGRDVITAAQTAGVATDAQAAEALALLEQRFGTAAASTSLFATGLTGATKLLGAMGLALSVEQVVAFGEGVFTSASHLVDQATQLGVSTDALQAYQAALKDNGAEATDANTLISKLSQTIGAAQNGSATARAEFNLLGVNWRTLAAASNPLQAGVQAVSEAILNIQDPTVRAQAQLDFFGRTGKEVAAALPTLSQSVDQMTASLDAQGRLYDSGLAQKAKDAGDAMSKSFQQLEVQAGPPVTFIANQMSLLLEAMNGVVRAGKDIATLNWEEIKEAFAASDPTLGLQPAKKPPPKFKPYVMTPADTKAFLNPPSSNTFGSTDNFDQNLAKEQQAADLAGLSANQRAREEAAIAAANALLKDNVTYTGKVSDYSGSVVQNYQQALKVLGPTRDAEIERAASLAQSATAAQKLKESFDQYLLGLVQAQQIAGETTAQRAAETDVIKAAQVLEAQNNVIESRRSKTYAEALAYLQKYASQQQISDVEASASLTATNALRAQQIEQQAELAAGLGVDADHRAVVVETMKQEIDLYGTINQNGQLEINATDAQIAALKQKNLAIQAIQDKTAFNDYIANLKQEASLAGLSADARQQQEAVLQEMHATHGTLTQDQADEVTGIIAARQETEKWQAVVQGLQGDFENFIEDALDKGQLNFAKFFQSIEASFVQMLAQMAAQALTQPIIVPMVQEVAGTLGLGTGGISGGSGALGSLGGLGSLSGLGGSISAGVSSLGGLLGFATASQIPTAAGLSGALGGISTTSIPVSLGAQTGSIFGATTLGGALAGAGLGSVASSLLFGNKNDAGIGGTGGAAAGALIGSLVPGIGTLIGGLIGGLAGGGLGSLTGSGNQSSTANLTNGGTNFAIVQSGSDQNTQMVTQAATSINQAVAALQQAGVTLTNSVSGINIGTQKDYLYYADGTKQKLADGADPSDVTTQVLDQLLSTASTTNSDIAKVIATYQGNGGINSSNLSQFLSDIGFANNIASTNFNPAPLTQDEQTLQTINSEFATAIARAQQLGLDTTSLATARDQAIQTLIDSFDSDTETAIQQMSDPIAAAMSALVTAQKARLDEATQLGANITAVIQRNTLESQQALDGYISSITAVNDNVSQWQQDATALAKAEVEASDAAAALGFGLDQVSQASAAANAALAGSFNASISDSILKITNPNLEAYNTLLATQAQRISDAIAAGGDLNQVYQLNTLEQRQLAQQQSGVSQTLQNLVQQFSGFSTSLSQFLGTLSGSDLSGNNPLAQYALDRSNFVAMAQAAIGGDADALTGLQASAEAFLSDSKTASATSAQYSSDLALVKAAVTQAMGTAQGIANDDTSALAALVGAVAAIPGHASGLDRVPYDGYLMYAHQNEAVLTASDAAVWRAGGQGNAALLAELQRLRAAQTAGNVTLKDMHKFWRRVTRDGQALMVQQAS